MQNAIVNPTLKIGSQGQAVKELQMLLNKRSNRDYWLVVDGVFGAKTEALVETFQRIYFLEIDGIVGSKTWQALNTNAPVDVPVLRRGSQGDLVKRMQQALSEISSQFKLTTDGVFGPKTEAAVKEFQQRSGAEVDQAGKVIVGSKTWAALSRNLAYFTFSM